MALADTINNDIKTAMLAKDKETLEALRAVKSALLLAQTEKGSQDGISNDTELKLLQKLVKQRKESGEIFTAQGRADLAEVEFFQAKVIERYLPAQLSEADIEAVIKQVIAQVGATTPADMGKVMGAASKQLAGKADNRLVSDIVKRLLS